MCTTWDIENKMRDGINLPDNKTVQTLTTNVCKKASVDTRILHTKISGNKKKKDFRIIKQK